jgi:hypothetical protein
VLLLLDCPCAAARGCCCPCQAAPSAHCHAQLLLAPPHPFGLLLCARAPQAGAGAAPGGSLLAGRMHRKRLHAEHQQSSAAGFISWLIDKKPAGSEPETRKVMSAAAATVPQFCHPHPTALWRLHAPGSCRVVSDRRACQSWPLGKWRTSTSQCTLPTRSCQAAPAGGRAMGGCVHPFVCKAALIDG